MSTHHPSIVVSTKPPSFFFGSLGASRASEITGSRHSRGVNAARGQCFKPTVLYFCPDFLPNLPGKRIKRSEARNGLWQSEIKNLKVKSAIGIPLSLTILSKTQALCSVCRSIKRAFFHFCAVR